ncbi:MAG: MBL fold metallo-hydrolase [Pseudoxanthomonas sp.]
MRNPYYRGPASDHFDGRRFFSPDHAPTDRSLAEVWRWRRTSTPARWDAPPPVARAVPEAHPARPTVTLVGHATALVQLGGRNLLVDPVWSERASPLRFAGPRRYNRPGIALADLPPIDAVLLTHNHYDHLDLATLRALHAAHDPLLVTPLGNDVLVRRRIPAQRCVALDWWQAGVLGDLAITVVPALHWSSRTPWDRRMALWGGFHLRHGDFGLYIAGDTAYGNGWPFRQLRQRLGAPDLALLPIGAYEPRWFMQPQHMDAAQAVQAMLDCSARQALGVHWGTFQLTDEARTAPRDLLQATLLERAVPMQRFQAMEAGQVWTPRAH